MTVFWHEIKRGRTAFAVWTAAVAFLMVVCVFLFPEMRGEMEQAGDMFSSMGSFTAAFGMDRLNFGEFLGFYSIECGNILGLGGALFAALTGAGMLAKEQKEHTADFLLTHPAGRGRIVSGKLAAVAVQILMLNGMALLLAAGSVLLIGEEAAWDKWLLLHLAYLFAQLEIGAVCFGVSAFLSGNSAGIGLGLAILWYFCNIIANLTEKARFLKYFTPFGYAEGADIVNSGRLDGGMLLAGAALAAAGILAAYVRYGRKDI
ncbi:MAG: ABC transporter permease subunit [Lachnospiraceae bacterium]|jgi:ABC-2 type transport system permease protein|nr:ABC transporter permease subunit [Lachnospiraceae bacterium]